MKIRWEILRLHLVDLISTGEIEITGGIKITSMVLKLPCEFRIWSLNSKSSGRDLLGTRIPRFCGMMPMASNHASPWNITVSDGVVVGGLNLMRAGGNVTRYWWSAIGSIPTAPCCIFFWRTFVR
jgi:hypothetical protein